MKYLKEKTDEKILYIIGLVVLSILLIVTILNSFFHISPSKYLWDCTFYKVTHLYCPGCGITRAVTCILQGELLKSLSYNAVALYIGILGILFMITHTVELIVHSMLLKKHSHTNTTKKERSSAILKPLSSIKGLKFHPIYVYIALVMIVAQCIFKNYLLIKNGVPPM